MTAKNKPSIEAAFAIGRPARTAAFKTCSRCKGTGWWQLARKCFKCGGVGHAEVVTLATQIRDKRIHIAQVIEMIVGHEAYLATATRRWSRIQQEAQLESERTNLVRLETELAAMLAQVPA